jgi:hypothetical protein
MKKKKFNKFILGEIFCQVFVTCDVLLCTSSILNLCAIAVGYFHLQKKQKINSIILFSLIVIGQ